LKNFSNIAILENKRSSKEIIICQLLLSSLWDCFVRFFNNASL